MRLHQSSAYPDGCYWYCGHVKKNQRKCKKNLSVRTGTWFSQSRLFLVEIVGVITFHGKLYLVIVFFFADLDCIYIFFGGAAHHLIKSSKTFKLTTGKPLLIGTGRVGKQLLSCVLFFPSLLAGLTLLSRSMNRCLANVSYFTLTSTFIKVNYLNFFRRLSTNGVKFDLIGDSVPLQATAQASKSSANRTLKNAHDVPIR